MNPNWKHVDKWVLRGDGRFVVEVSRHSETPSRYCEEGEHRWCVYAYVYPTHPLFAKFDKTKDIFQDCVKDAPLHWGCTLIEYPHYRSGDEVICTSVKFGADYHHIDDGHFTFMATAAEAEGVFADAEELHAWLHGMPSDQAEGGAQ